MQRFNVVLTLLGSYVHFPVETEGGHDAAVAVGQHLAEKLGAVFLYADELPQQGSAS